MMRVEPVGMGFSSAEVIPEGLLSTHVLYIQACSVYQPCLLLSSEEASFLRALPYACKIVNDQLSDVKTCWV